MFTLVAWQHEHKNSIAVPSAQIEAQAKAKPSTCATHTHRDISICSAVLALLLRSILNVAPAMPATLEGRKKITETRLHRHYVTLNISYNGRKVAGVSYVYSYEFHLNCNCISQTHTAYHAAGRNQRANWTRNSWVATKNRRIRTWSEIIWCQSAWAFINSWN